jgi:protein-L-isoaspartate(D-aspartate) O-methyltransferase
MIDLAERRRFFAEEIEALADITTPGLVEAAARVPRERFLRPGPWLVRGEAELLSGPRRTIDADPSRVYHNYSIAVDPDRQMFNGSPALLIASIDKLRLSRGARVLHVGAGLGYYTAIMAETVGPEGRVVAIEVDPIIGAEAQRNLSDRPWIELQIHDGSRPIGETFDGILVNAGVTHPLESWLEALTIGGHLVLPLTVPVPQIGTTIGKGVQVLVTRTERDAFTARFLTFIIIYSALGLRDDSLNEPLGRAMLRMPMPPLKRLRRDQHDPASTCWFHADRFCLSLD